MLISLLFDSPLLFFLVFSALVISICIHEFAHAFVADKLGDPTPRQFGRVTLNPRAHLDPLGTLFLVFAGFGWGRPVPINIYNLRNPKRDAAIISFAGPLSNFLMAGLFALLIRFTVGGLFTQFFYFLIFYNLVLGVFNLLPLHPLDGFKVVNGVLPTRLSWQWEQMAPYGIYLLLLLAFTGSVSRLLNPFLSFAFKVFGLE